MTAPLDLAPIRARAEAATPTVQQIESLLREHANALMEEARFETLATSERVADTADPLCREIRSLAHQHAAANDDRVALLAEVARLARLYGKAVNAIKGQARAWRNAAEADRLRWEMTRAMANEVVAIPLLAGTMLRTLADNALGKAPVMDDGSDWPRWLLRVLADPLIKMMERVPNFFEAVMTLPGKRYVLTIMHEEGKTPATMLAESRAEVARLAEEVERLRERLSHAREFQVGEFSLERWENGWSIQRSSDGRYFCNDSLPSQWTRQLTIACDTLDAAWTALDAARRGEAGQGGGE